MCYYRSIISRDAVRDCWQVCVIWDDTDPNSIIAQTEVSSIEPSTIDAAIRSMGFRIVGWDDAPALNEGERIVIRENSVHIWFDPKTRDWHMTKPVR